MAQNMTENSLLLKMHDMIDPINLLLVFLFSSTWQVVPKREKMKIQNKVDVLVNTCKNCHQTTKVEIRLFSDFTDKDKIVNKWRAGLPITENSVTTICRYHQHPL